MLSNCSWRPAAKYDVKNEKKFNHIDLIEIHQRN